MELDEDEHEHEEACPGAAVRRLLRLVRMSERDPSNSVGKE